MTEAPAPPRRSLLLRALRAFAILLAVLIVAVVGLVGYVTRSESGLRFALAQTQRLMHGALQIGSSSGSLLNELDLRDLSYTGPDGTVVTIAHVHLRIAPRALLSRQLHVERLDVEIFVVRPAARAENAPPKAATRLPVKLPVDVVIDALNLSGFALYSSREPEAPPFAIEQAELVGKWRGDTITIASLKTALSWTGPLQAQADARMASDHIEFEQLLIQGPGEISAKGTLGIGAAHSALALQWQQLHWPLVLPDEKPAQVGAIEGGMKLDGSFEHYAFDLNTKATLQGRAAQLAAQGSGSLQSLTIDQLQLDTLAGDGSDPKTAGQRGAISAKGHVDWSPQVLVELQAVLEHIDPALFAAGVTGDINGTLNTTTTLANGRPEMVFTANIARSTLRGQPFSLSAEGSTDTRAARVRNLLVQAGGGRVQAQGEVAWTPQLAGNLDAQITKLNPALFAKDWPGEINGSLKLRTEKGAKAPIRFDAQIDNSRLRGYPVKLAAQGALAGKTVTVQQLRLDSGATRLSASGQATPPYDLGGDFESPDLAALYPKLAGRGKFDFRFTGTLENPHLVTRGEATALRYDKETVARLVWSADVDPKVDSKIAVIATQADVGFIVQSLKLDITGLEIYHRAELVAQTEHGKVNLVLQGGYDRRRREWGGELAALGLAPNGLAAWSLEKSAGILIGRQRRALEPACLKGADGRACFNLEQNVLSDGTRVGWNIERLLLAAFQPLLPPDYRLGGSVDGDGKINFTGGDVVDAVASLNLRDAQFEVPDAPPFHLKIGTLRADQREGRLHGVVALVTEQGQIDADVTAAPGASFVERALSGQIKADFPTIAFIEPLLPQLRSLDGKLAGAFDVSGTPKSPRLGGQLRLSEGHAKLIVAGITLQDVRLNLSGNGNGPLTLDGSLRSGDGTMTVTGSVDPFVTPLLADIRLQGDNFQAMNTAEARAWVSPDLHLVRDAKGAKLTGQLTVPNADITPKGLGGGGVEVSRDQVLVGAETPPPKATLPVTVELRLVLGKAVRIEGFGLKTRIEGEVTVTQEPQRAARGRGELRLEDGHYKAYGQDLTIDDGRLLFTGDAVTKPAVDITASRKPREDITVGVRVRGTLARPELTLQSSPTLPREQQLSWLILGRSLETSSTQDRGLVSRAALSLGLGGGDYIANLIGKKVGLDQLSVGGVGSNGSEVAANAQSIAGSQAAGSSVDATTQVAQLTLGKYLTPRLFISYGISLFQQGYTFRLLYTLGHGFKLSTESGTASGGDLIYSTERGKRKAPPPKPREETPAPAAGSGAQTPP